jgi:biopolymer transport protein ExbD
MLDKPSHASRKEINLIPLINIIFLLLTFFMVAGTIDKVDPFILSLPSASKNGNIKPQKSSIIYMHKDGRVVVNNDLVMKKDFSTIVNTLVLENKGKELLIKADSEVASSDLIWVMRAIESVGGSDVSIVTKVVK